MSFILAILLAVLMFSLLVFVHELGHFVTAKLSGVQVNEFAMFMGPAIAKWKWGQTQYSIRCIPIGGYCAMEGEDEDTDSPNSFQKAAWWKRLIILVAGSAMNLLIGFLIMLVFYMPAQNTMQPVIESFTDFATVDGENGLQVGDRFLEIDGEKIYMGSDFSLLMTLNPADVHDLVVERNGQKVYLNDFTMEKHVVKDKNGNEDLKFGINFQLDNHLSFGDKLNLAWKDCLNTVRNVRLSLQMLLSGKAGLSEMTGPVGIVVMMSDTAQNSKTTFDAIWTILYFGAFLSINLGIMNLLPIPALDGGRVFGLLITTALETILRKKLNPKIEGYIHGVGMIILLVLMALIMFKDVIFIFKR